MQSYMANHPPALTCLIEGESSPIIVEPKEDISIMKLRELIQEAGKNRVFREVDAMDLTLWKVRISWASNNTTNFTAGGSRKPAQR